MSVTNADDAKEVRAYFLNHSMKGSYYLKPFPLDQAILEAKDILTVQPKRAQWGGETRGEVMLMFLSDVYIPLFPI